MIQGLILLFISVSTLLLIPLSSYYLQRKQYIKDDWMYFSGESKKDSALYSIYLFFAGWKLTKHYVNKIKSHINRYYPGRDKEASIRSIKIYMFEMSMGLLAMTVIIIFRIGIQYSIGLLALVYFINTGHVHKLNERMDKLLIEDMIKMVIKVRHCYESSAGTLKEALEMATEGDVPESMIVHLNYLISVLEEEDMEESIKQYMENVPNDYMKEFMALCCTIEEFEDPKVGNGLSQFLTRLLNLRVRMENDLRNRKRKNHLFYGFLFGVAFPLYLIPLIRIWGVDSMPALEKYYSGSYGIWGSIISFILVIVIFRKIIQLQENVHLLEKDHYILYKLCEMGRLNEWLKNVTSKNEGKKRRTEELLFNAAENITVEQFYLKQIILAILVFVLSNVIFIGIHVNQRVYDIRNTKDLGNITSAISEEEEENLRITIGKTLKKYAGIKITDDIKKQIKQDVESNISEYAQKGAYEEILNRLIKYNGEYYKWYELIISILFAIIGFYYPVWEVLYESKLVKANMRKEMMQLMAVLSILAPIAQMTPEIMLSWMEQFAFIFLPIIQKCKDCLYDEEAMEDILEEIKYDPMKRIIENLKVSDTCGIIVAFDGLEAEQLSYREDQKQEDMLSLDDNSAMATFMATIPFGFILTVFMIIPILKESMKLFLNQI